MSLTLRQSQAHCSLGRVLPPCCRAQARCRRPPKCTVLHSTSSSNAEELCFPLSPSAITARKWGFHSQQARDNYAQRGHIDADLTRQQPSLKAPDALLASSPYLTTTSQQTIGTATEKSSLFSSLLSSGFPMHTATCRSFESTAGSSPCPSLLPQPGRAVQPSPPSFISDII